MAVAAAFFDTYGDDGRVFGVTLDSALNAVYTVADSYEACAAFQGSKYVQADAVAAIAQAVEFLQKEKAVLFVGTPCMVAALKTRAEKVGVRTEKLWLIDLICHGTVSAALWQDYLAWMEKIYKAKVTEYSFRYKKVAWHGYPVYVKFSNGKEIVDTYYARAYIRAFLKGLIMRQSCYCCAYKNTNRCGDLTLGDFWGAQTVLQGIDTSDGVSLIMENSQQGAAIMEKLHRSAAADVYLQKISTEVAMQRQDNLKHALQKPKEYDLFKEVYKKQGFDAAIRRAGIVTVSGRIRSMGIVLLKKTGLYQAAKHLCDRRQSN